MKLYVGNLSPKATSEELKDLFGKYGDIIRIEIEWNRIAGRHCGAAILEMNLTEAMTAVRMLNGHPFRNRRLYITLMGDTSTASIYGAKMAAQSK